MDKTSTTTAVIRIVLFISTLLSLSSSWAGTGCASVFVCLRNPAISKFRKFVVCSWMLVERIDASRRM